MMLKEKQVILFQGDSITDAEHHQDPDELGRGYVRMVAETIKAFHPEKKIRIINRGIGGNTVLDLQNRWNKDCIDLNPDIVFIFVGINDTWQRYGVNSPVSAEEFKKVYRDIIIHTKTETHAQIVLIEPFLLPVSIEQEAWWEDLAGKQAVIHQLSKEFALRLIALDGILAQAAAQTPIQVFTADGVHPTAEGARIIAKQILSVLM